MSKPRDPKNLVVGLDIGTSKIVCIVAEINDEGTLDIIGMGTHPSRGLRRGVVVNIEATVNAIQRALEEAELMADCKIREVYTGIAGSHIKSFNSHGMFAIKDKEISQMDVDRVVDTARAVNIPTDQQILHTIPQEFIVDGQEDVRDPLGMSAVRLEVKVHIVTGAVSAAQNIIKCIRRCGLEVGDLVLQPLASAMAVLTEDEKELGVCLVDIGGGTTDIAVFTDGAIRHTAVIPVAGDQVNNDIAVALRTPPKEAEDIKIQYGCALRQLADARDMIEVPGIGDRPPRTLSKQTLADSSSRAWKNSIRWCRRNCAAAGSRNCCRPASSSPAARPGCRAWSSSAKKCSTCRCAWAGRVTKAGSPTSCATRVTPPAWGC